MARSQHNWKYSIYFTGSSLPSLYVIIVHRHLSNIYTESVVTSELWEVAIINMLSKIHGFFITLSFREMYVSIIYVILR